MITYLNPLTDKRYQDFISNHPDATIFHSPAWIRVLHESYGFRPGCVVSEEYGKVNGVLPYMETRSMIGKRRCVSLPFSDFCEPLFTTGNSFEAALKCLINKSEQFAWHNIEIRGGMKYLTETPSFQSVFSHKVNCALTHDSLFKSFSGTTRRNIRKAEKSDLSVIHDNSIKTVLSFYRLNSITRRYHGLPPQPLSFFKNLGNYLLKNNGFITLAFYNGIPVAGSIFLIWGKNAVYKYGASDKHYQHLRPNNLVMWEGIKRCQDKGCESVNLGRTEFNHAGLIQYKHGFNPDEEIVHYFRYIPQKAVFMRKKESGSQKVYNFMFSKLPIPILRIIGNKLYQFVG